MGNKYTASYKRMIQEHLEDNWDIVDEETALSTLAWLRDCGHRKYFQAVLEYNNYFSDFSLDSIRSFIKKCQSQNIIAPEFPDELDRFIQVLKRFLTIISKKKE